VAYAFAGGGRREPSGLDVAADGGSNGDGSNHNAFYSPVATHGYSASIFISLVASNTVKLPDGGILAYLVARYRNFNYLD
jgi:hypothetical protein